LIRIKSSDVAEERGSKSRGRRRASDGNSKSTRKSKGQVNGGALGGWSPAHASKKTTPGHETEEQVGQTNPQEKSKAQHRHKSTTKGQDHK
jgi:hypothetical protein